MRLTINKQLPDSVNNKILDIFTDAMFEPIDLKLMAYICTKLSFIYPELIITKSEIDKDGLGMTIFFEFESEEEILFRLKN